MKRSSLLAVVGLAAVASSIALAQPPKDTKPTKPGTPSAQPQLPPGMSEADVKACTEAATPGPVRVVVEIAVDDFVENQPVAAITEQELPYPVVFVGREITTGVG